MKQGTSLISQGSELVFTSVAVYGRWALRSLNLTQQRANLVMTHNGPLYLRYHQRTLVSESSPTPGSVVVSDDPGKIYFKTYSRFPRIALPDPTPPHTPSLHACILGRKSERSFSRHSMMQLVDLSRILVGLQITSDEGHTDYHSRRAYPSAGKCYPIEAYILPLRVEGLKHHAYHYHVRTHSLEEMWPFGDSDFGACFSRDHWCRDAGAVVVLTGCHARGYLKYLEKAYQYCLLEAGHAAQNIHLLSAGEGLNCCSYGGFYDKPLMRLLDLNPNEEILLHTLLVGKKA